MIPGLGMPLMVGGGGGVSAGGGGKLELVETITLLVPSSADVTFSGLDGDTDKRYLLVGNIPGNGGAGNAALYLRFNGDTGGNYPYAELSVDGSVPSSTAAGSATSSAAPLGYWGGAATDSASCVEAWINVSREGVARSRTVLSRTFRKDGRVLAIAGSGWTNTADNVTSISLPLSGITMAAGAEFSLYRVSQS